MPRGLTVADPPRSSRCKRYCIKSVMIPKKRLHTDYDTAEVQVENESGEHFTVTEGDLIKFVSGDKLKFGKVFRLQEEKRRGRKVYATVHQLFDLKEVRERLGETQFADLLQNRHLTDTDLHHELFLSDDEKWTVPASQILERICGVQPAEYAKWFAKRRNIKVSPALHSQPTLSCKLHSIHLLCRLNNIHVQVPKDVYRISAKFEKPDNVRGIRKLSTPSSKCTPLVRASDKAFFSAEVRAVARKVHHPGRPPLR